MVLMGTHTGEQKHMEFCRLVGKPNFYQNLPHINVKQWVEKYGREIPLITGSGEGLWLSWKTVKLFVLEKGKGRDRLSWKSELKKDEWLIRKYS
jgi:hypothetical protein